MPAKDVMRSQSETHLLEPFGVEVAALSFDEGVSRVVEWAEQPTQGRSVCLANVHMLVEATRHRCLSAALREADLVLADGMPLVWMMSGNRKGPERVAGMDLLPALCSAAETRNIPVYFWGSTAAALRALAERLRREHPRIRVTGMRAPEVGRIRHRESREVLDQIRETGARLVFVALGCPKQELWMHRHRGTAQAVFVGIGGALDVYAGLQPRAPEAMQRLGLEWVHRLAQEPARLWRRYLITNTIFAWRVCRSCFAGPHASNGRKQVIP